MLHELKVINEYTNTVKEIQLLHILKEIQLLRFQVGNDYSYGIIDADSKSSVVTGWCSCFKNKNKICIEQGDRKAHNRKEKHYL